MRQLHGAARDVALGRDDREERLTVEADVACRRRADRRRRPATTSFLPGNVGGGQHRDDAGHARGRPRHRARRRRPRAFGDCPMATCSVPSGSRISSMYCAVPCTCLSAESCGSGWRTWRGGSVGSASGPGVRSRSWRLLRRLQGVAVADRSASRGSRQMRFRSSALNKQIARDRRCDRPPTRGGRREAGSPARAPPMALAPRRRLVERDADQRRLRPARASGCRPCRRRRRAPTRCGGRRA